MNKKVLSAILFSALFAGTGTFTSCIDTDEPAGIEELRGAKAELIRAKVAVEQAQASLLMAKAEVQKAKAAKELADAEISKAMAALEQAKADSINVKTEQEREALKMIIAKNQMALDTLQLEHQKIMADLNKQVAESNYAYEMALAQIAVLKELYPMGKENGWTLLNLEQEVKTWKGIVASADTVVMEKQAAYDSALVKYEYLGELDEAYLESQVDTAEIKLAREQAKLAKYENWLEEDVTTKDWRAEVEALLAEKDSLTKLYALVNTELVLAQNSDEYKALLAAQTEAQKTALTDAAYSYTYTDVNVNTGAAESKTYVFYGVKNSSGVVTTTKLNDAFETTTGADSLSAEITDLTLDTIANYNTAGVLVGGKLYYDKKNLASFTAEVKHFLDTIAATAAADTTLKAESDAAIKAWKDALKAYAEADTTMQTKLDSAISKRSAWNALSVDKQTPKNIDAYRKAMLDYLTVAVKNGAVLNTKGVLVPQDSVWVANGNTATKDKSYSLETAATVLADTTKTFFAIKTLGVDFIGAGSGTGTGSYVDKATAKSKSFTWDTNVIKTAAPSVGKETDAPYLTTTLLGKLQSASLKAFGKASQYNNLVAGFAHGSRSYLHVQPTEDDVKNIAFFGGYTNAQIHNVSNGLLGAYGKYLIAKIEGVVEYAKNYESIIENLEGAIEFWDATYKTLDAKLTAWKDAKKAAEKAVTDYQVANRFNATADRLTELSTEAGRLQIIATNLQFAIQTYMPDGMQVADYGTEAFINAVEGIIAQQQYIVREKERELATLKIAVEMEDTDSSVELTLKKKQLDDAIAALEDAQAELDKALAELAKALEIIAALNAE